MSQQFDQLNERDLSPRPNRVKGAMTAVVFATVLVNLFLLLAAWSDKSWGAFAIAIMFGPIANGIIMLGSLIGIPFVKAAANGAAIAPYVLTGIVSPLIAVAIDLMAISSMRLHGC